MGAAGLATAARFHKIFAGMSKAYGTYDLSRATTREADGKQEGKAYTKRAPVTEELWEAHLSGKMGLGIVPIRDDNTAVFGAIDIDVYDAINHHSIVQTLARQGIPLIVCRSKSGGAHIYGFSTEPIEAARMQAKMREIASILGFGNSEIFPKQTKILVEQGDAGQWINMPYFGGTRGMRFAIDIDGNAMQVDQFLDYIDDCKQTPAWFDTPIKLVDDFPDGPPCLQILGSLGYPKGTRNDGLYNIGVYLKKSDPDDWENKLDVYNHKFMTPPLTNQEVQGVAKSLKRKEYNYTCTRQPICQHCNAALCRTKKHGVGNGQGKLPSLGGLTKLATMPPTWFWTIDGVRMELATEDIQEPRRFQRKCLDYLNMMPSIPTAPVWQAAVQQAMNSVTVVEAPKDASLEGQFWEMVEKFATGRAQALTKEEIVLGKPYTNAGRVFFRMADLISYMNIHKFNDYKPHKITAMLKEHGAEHHADSFKGRTVNYWSIPAFTVQNQEFDVPDTIGPKDSF